MILIYLDISQDVERLYPPKNVRISSNKVSFGLENKKLIKKFLALECQNCDVKLGNFYY